MVQVVAAIIEREGRILIGRRKPEQSHPLQWEFPGGKVEPGESPEQALARELEEELGIRGAIGQEIERYDYTYPGRNPITLFFIRVTSYEGEPRNLIFAELRWEPRANLAAFDFVEGDRRFLATYTGLMSPAIKLIDPSENEFLASLEARAKQPNTFFRAMANRPEVLKNFVPLYGAVVGPGSVDRRIKELVYLTCAYFNHCAYCSASHSKSGQKAGIAEDEMRALQAGDDSRFSEAERAAIAYARELSRTANAAESRAALAAHFTSEQVVEITLVAAMANFTNRFNNALQIFPEA